ncbi:hypothetical protein QZH41_017801 [Actinostola sp. cb2023]|nr:hypothetical protein QZH41_017801 [Actinostola sp. cb2023]
MKKFFEKAKLEIKFRKVGGGHTLSEDKKANRPSTSHSDVPGSRAAPCPGSQRAGEAALHRINQQEKASSKKPHSATATWKHDTKPPTSSTAGAAGSSSMDFDKLKREVQREFYDEGSRNADSATPNPTLAPPEPVEVECAPKLSVDGIYFKCPLCPMTFILKDKNNHLKECLEIQYSESPHAVAALIIQTVNTDKDRVKACIDILCRYIDNVCNNPGEEKFMKIKQSNKIFQERVSSITGAAEFIAACGFEDKEIEQEDKTEKFYVIPTDKANDIETLQTYKAILISTEPIRAKLDRNLQEINTRNVFDFRLDEIDKNSQLRTKAMRDTDKKSTKTYRFTLIRVRFPDGTILQGTFYSREKLRDLFAFVRESLVSDWQPFVLSDPTGQLKAEESTLNDLGLVPAAVVNFAWDANIMADIIAASGSVQQDSYLKPDLMALIQELT